MGGHVSDSVNRLGQHDRQHPRPAGGRALAQEYGFRWRQDVLGDVDLLVNATPSTGPASGYRAVFRLMLQ